MKWKGLARLFVLASLLVGAPVLGQTFYVDGAFGSDSATGRSWGEAFATVQRGLDAARAASLLARTRPRVNVAAGAYPVANAVVDFPVALVGGYPPGGGPRDRGANETRLDGGGSRRVLTFAAGSGRSVLDGIFVTGALECAVCLEDDTIVRNCTIADNAGTGVQASAGTVERSRILRNTLGGLLAYPPSSAECWRPIRVSENLLEGNSQSGISAGDDRFCRMADPLRTSSIVVKHNRMHGTRTGQGSVGSGLYISCCPLAFDNEVLDSEGAGVTLSGATGSPPRWGPTAPLLNLTVALSGGAGIRVTMATDLHLSRSVLWANVGGDIENPPATMDVSYTLSEGLLPGPGNISSTDPLLIPGPGGNLCLSQTAAGQANDSPALDAGDLTAWSAGLAFRTTRTDGIRDDGTADLGFHAEPPRFTVSRGTNPVSLAARLVDVALPVLDPGAIGPPAPSLLYYSVDSDTVILLRRSGPDVEIRFDYQEFD